jgi:hypothetical protein
MTSRQAIQESIRRWTLARAFAYEEQNAPADERFQVGYTDGWRDIILGFGATWDEAFRLADQTPIDTCTILWWGLTRMASNRDTPAGAAAVRCVRATRSGGRRQRSNAWWKPARLAARSTVLPEGVRICGHADLVLPGVISPKQPAAHR